MRSDIVFLLYFYYNDLWRDFIKNIQEKEGTDMKIAAAQMSLLLGDVEHNYKQAEEWIRNAAQEKPDIVVLPEMWNTSFYPDDIYELADENGRRTQAFLSELAVRFGVHIIGGSVAVRRGEKLYNTMYVAERSGRIVGSYDKVHLFAPGHEDEKFTPGDHSFAFSLDSVPMATVICYDVRFPEWVRMATLSGAQIIFVPAAWPTSRIDHWHILNQARAIENQLFIVAVNSCGNTDSMQFGGHSMIIDPWGNVLAQGGDGEELMRADIDLDSVADIRSRINIFHDRQPALYDLT